MSVCHGLLDLWAKSWVDSNWIKIRAKNRNFEACKTCIVGLSRMFIICNNLSCPGGDFTNFDQKLRFTQRERERERERAFWFVGFKFIWSLIILKGKTKELRLFVFDTFFHFKKKTSTKILFFWFFINKLKCFSMCLHIFIADRKYWECNFDSIFFLRIQEFNFHGITK